MDKYHLLFAGEVAKGQDPEVVKTRMSRLLDIDPGPELDRLFDGEPHILHHDLEREQLNEAFLALARTGARPVIAEVVKVDTPPLPVVEEVEDTKEIVEPASEVAVPPGISTPIPEKVADSADANSIGKPEDETAFDAGSSPNLFALRLSDRAKPDYSVAHKGFLEMRGLKSLLAGLLGAITVYLLSALLGGDPDQPDLGGPRVLQVDFAKNLYVAVGPYVVKHDASGAVTDEFDLREFGLQSADGGFAVFSNGDLLVAGVGDQGRTLHRCEVTSESCTPLAIDLPAEAGLEFVTLDGNDAFYLTSPGGQLIYKFSGSGQQRYESKPLYDDPSNVVMHRGLIYVANRGESNIVSALPDNVGFGAVLERQSLANPEAESLSHTQLHTISRAGDFWWALLRSADGNSSGLYQYDNQWNYVATADLPEGAIADSLAVWNEQLLVVDEIGRIVYRYSIGGELLSPLDSAVVNELSAEPGAGWEWLPNLRRMILGLIILQVAALLAAVGYCRLRSQIYTPPHDPEEVLFSPDDSNIRWLGVSEKVRDRVKLMGCGVVAGFLLILVAARLGFLPEVLALGLLVVCMVLIAELVGLYQGSFAYLGILGDRLILVDPDSTYRVARTSRLQHRERHLMIDDVIVCLGNRFQHLFEPSELEEFVQPLMMRGIRTDRLTLQIKMIETGHPQLVARVVAAVAAVVAILYLGVW